MRGSGVGWVMGMVVGGIVVGGGGVTLEEPPHPSRAIQEVTSSARPIGVLFMVMPPGPSEPGRLAGRHVPAAHEAGGRVEVPLLVVGVRDLDRELLLFDDRAYA